MLNSAPQYWSSLSGCSRRSEPESEGLPGWLPGWGRTCDSLPPILECYLAKPWLSLLFPTTEFSVDSSFTSSLPSHISSVFIRCGWNLTQTLWFDTDSSGPGWHSSSAILCQFLRSLSCPLMATQLCTRQTYLLWLFDLIMVTGSLLVCVSWFTVNSEIHNDGWLTFSEVVREKKKK